MSAHREVPMSLDTESAFGLFLLRITAAERDVRQCCQHHDDAPA